MWCQTGLVLYTFIIVVMDIFVNELLSSFNGLGLLSINTFAFENAEEVFSTGIIQGSSRSGHGRSNAILLGQSIVHETGERIV